MLFRRARPTMLSASQKVVGPQRRAVASRPARASLTVQAVAAVPKPSSTKAATVSSEVAKDLYYDMVLGREFEEMCAQMYYRGKMFGFVHLYSGQEAVSSGVIRALRPDDYVCSTYRDHVHALSKGVTARCVHDACLHGVLYTCGGRTGGHWVQLWYGST